MEQKRDIHRGLLFILAAMTGGWLSCFPLSGPARAQDAIPQDRSAAVIFAYHRIGEDQSPDTSIRTAQFETHLRELLSGPYHIAALPDVIAALKEDKPLPPRTVVLTFDGGHRSTLENGLPFLLEHEIPFTLFVATDHLDNTLPGTIGWSALRRLKRHKFVTVGIHPARYDRLMTEDKEEIRRQINKARARYREELGEDPAFFAYPFGEYSAAYEAVIREQGFTAAFGEQSGVAFAGSAMTALPRFPMTERYAGPERFRLTANALPLPVSGLTPADPWLETRRPAIGFSIDPALAEQLGQLSCFVSGQKPPDIVPVGQSRVELRLEKPFEDDRTRVNCTLPGPPPGPEEDSETPRWRWLGMLFGLTPGPAFAPATYSPPGLPELQE